MRTVYNSSALKNLTVDEYINFEKINHENIYL